jgi:hypothetical protein
LTDVPQPRIASKAIAGPQERRAHPALAAARSGCDLRDAKAHSTGMQTFVVMLQKVAFVPFLLLVVTLQKR